MPAIDNLSGKTSENQNKQQSFSDEENCSSCEIRIVCGGSKFGKMPDSCEDAFFITERGFGVADGVSGWNDYGFSSSAFANQLMDNCKKEIEDFISYKKLQQTKPKKKKMRKTGSYLSMENLGVVDDDEDDSPEDSGNDETATKV